MTNRMMPNPELSDAALLTADDPRPRAAIVGDPFQLQRVYGEAELDRVRSLVPTLEGIVTAADLDRLAGVQWIFSTWGMPRLEGEALERCEKLETVFYAAGSVKGFGQPLLERGVTIVSAWNQNAKPVAEFTLAQILLSGKAFYLNTRNAYRGARRGSADLPELGNFQTPVALLGFGAVGRSVAEHLQRFSFDVMVVDPMVDQAVLDAHDARRVTMEEAFATARVVSNHLPNLPGLRGAIDGKLFGAMIPGATFINTGRGAQVVEADLVRVLRDRLDLTALLDVTDPEPPPPDSPLLMLPNCYLSTHIAGSTGDEVRDLARSVIEVAGAMLRGEPATQTISLEMLGSMA